MQKNDSVIVSEEKIECFQKKILHWFTYNGRYFPWRKKSVTNYELIISEVLLQRTKAETVSKYLPLFLKKYSSWNKLGEATEQELQEIIKPLGLYKQKGLRLFKLAKELKSKKGRFPKERSQVEKIPMMGQYITNAYELYILKKKVPLLDVNMARLLERYFEPRKLADIRYDSFLQSLAHRVVNHEKSKEINWAILDFAAKVCKAKKPSCDNCMFINNCNFRKKFRFF